MTKIYLVRHGQTIFNQLNKVQGWCDSPLTEAGIQAALDCGRGLSRIKFAKAYSSDLRRAETSLKLIMNQNQHPLKQLISDKAFRELCFGDYEGLPEDKRKIACSKVILGHGDLHIINQQLKERNILPAQMMNAIQSIDTSGYAETYEQVQKRTITRLHDIAQEIESAGGGNILIVSHGVSISAIIDYLPGEKLKKVSDMKNMSVTILEYKDHGLSVETVASMKYVHDGKL